MAASSWTDGVDAEGFGQDGHELSGGKPCRSNI